MFQTIRTIIIGVIIGIANIIPGVSGGTMAVIFNVYDRIINCTKAGNFKKNIPFLVKLGAGAVVGILAFSRLIKYFYENFPVATSFAFAGLIIGSIPLIFKHTKKHCISENKKLPVSAIISFILTFSAMTAMAFLNPAQTAIKPFSWGLAAFMVLAGIIAAVAMILPGISGSLIMSAIGMYATIMSSISGITEFENFGSLLYVQNFILVIAILLGCLSGILIGLNGVRVLMEKAPAQTYSGILGLVIGSIFSVLPVQAPINTEFFIGLGVMTLTAIGAFFFSKTEAIAENK